MTVDELSKRLDQETAQIHARIDDHHTESQTIVRRQTANFYAFTDPMKKAHHDLEKNLERLQQRIESLEKYPPVIPSGPSADTPPVEGPPR